MLSPDGNEWWADLPKIAHHYVECYFEELTPVPNVLFVSGLDGPACCLPTINRIEVNDRMRPFVKVCRFLVLHELVNMKLFKIHKSPQPYDGDNFQNELKRLWEAGAYADLL